MDIAVELGLTLEETLTKLSHREKQLWDRYLRERWDRPSRSDWYLMQIASEVFNVLRKKSKAEPKDKMLKFGTLKRKLTNAEKRQREAMSRAKWLGITGVKQNGKRN